MRISKLFSYLSTVPTQIPESQKLCQSQELKFSPGRSLTAQQVTYRKASCNCPPLCPLRATANFSGSTLGIPLLPHWWQGECGNMPSEYHLRQIKAPETTQLWDTSWAPSPAAAQGRSQSWTGNFSASGGVTPAVSSSECKGKKTREGKWVGRTANVAQKDFMFLLHAINA